MVERRLPEWGRKRRKALGVLALNAGWAIGLALGFWYPEVGLFPHESPSGFFWALVLGLLSGLLVFSLTIMLYPAKWGHLLITPVAAGAALVLLIPVGFAAMPLSDWLLDRRVQRIAGEHPGQEFIPLIHFGEFWQGPG